MYYSPNIGPLEPANCKEECAQLEKAFPSGASISKATDASSDERGTGDQIQIFTRAIPTPLVTRLKWLSKCSEFYKQVSFIFLKVYDSELSV